MGFGHTCLISNRKLLPSVAEALYCTTDYTVKPHSRSHLIKDDEVVNNQAKVDLKFDHT